MGSSSRLILLLSSPFSSLLLHPRPSHFRYARLSHRLALSRPSLLPIKATHHIHSQTNNNSSTLKEDNFGDSSHSFWSNPRASHPWPEWSHMVHALSTAGYFDQHHRFAGDGIHDDEYVAYETLSEEFVRAASACLAFARNRSDILGSLSRRDIVVIVENGTPFLFKSALDSSRRMRSFLGSGRTNVLESGKAEMVDLMKYLLSYASNPSVSVSSERNNLYRRDNIESSVRNLLSELAEMSSRAPEHYQVPEVQTPKPLVGQQNIEMKRGDWICPKCTFMNFARNNKCLECEEPRPKRQLTGGEWECPQCDFFNYGRNMVCLRCDCKQPGEVSFGTVNPRPAYNGDYAAASKKADLDSSNQEKAERWFTRVSQQSNISDLPDEDFPEIMPLRKGENRFVVSTRKTPLQRRLEKSQYLQGSTNESVTNGNTNSHQAGGEIKTLDSSSINRSLDQILGPTSSRTETRSASTQFEHPRGNNSNFTPFVPLPADMFAKKPLNPEIGDSEKVLVTQEGSSESVPSKSSDQKTGLVSSMTNHHESVKSGESIVVEDNKEEREARKPDRWFKKVAELHDVPDLASPMPNEDYLPEMMPMRKGENRFVISKKKDRSFTSPTYKRQMAMEQTGAASNSKFVPFVPFPPDYFAKKDQKEPQQPNITESTVKNFRTDESSSSNTPQNTETQQTHRMGSLGEPAEKKENHHPTQNNSFTSQSRVISNDNSNNSRKETDLVGENNKNVNSSSSGWSGKSLEGSAVKETDPLDMSEEAKAERWFRRVAQIKDISELSQIPDEDFPSIMPMRKGVNRFVVSKRKTPLERRLTSPQYRRNLPIVQSSDPPPPNKENNDR